MAYIYHIINNKTHQRYIGQSNANSADGFKRVWDHFDNAYSDTTYSKEDSDVLQMLRYGGLKDFTINIYDEDDNYGIPEIVFDNFLNTFYPAGKRFSAQKNLITDQMITTTTSSGKQIQVNQRLVKLDMAEILHNINAYDKGLNPLGSEMGGAFTSWTITNNDIWGLQRGMGISEAHRVFLQLSAKALQVQNALNNAIANYLTNGNKKAWQNFLFNIAEEVILNPKLEQSYKRRYAKFKSMALNFFNETIINGLKRAIKKELTIWPELQIHFLNMDTIASNIADHLAKTLSWRLSTIKQWVEDSLDDKPLRIKMTQNTDWSFPAYLIISGTNIQADWWKFEFIGGKWIPEDLKRIQALKYFQRAVKLAKDPNFYNSVTALLPKPHKSQKYEDNYSRALTLIFQNYTKKKWAPSDMITTDSADNIYGIGYPIVPSNDTLLHKTRQYYKDDWEIRADFLGEYWNEFFFIMYSQIQSGSRFIHVNGNFIDSGFPDDVYYNPDIRIPANFNSNIQVYVAQHFAQGDPNIKYDLQTLKYY